MRESSTTSTATVHPPSSVRFAPDTDSARLSTSCSTSSRAVRTASPNDKRPFDAPSAIGRRLLDGPGLEQTIEHHTLDRGQLLVGDLTATTGVLRLDELGVQALGVVQLLLGELLHRPAEPQHSLDRRQR